jgi:hypothetical protein
MKYLPNRNDLLWCAGLLLIAAGIYFYSSSITMRMSDFAPLWLVRVAASLLVVCFFTAIGGGIGAVLRRKILGAAIFGGVAAFLIVLVLWPNRH